MTKTTAPTAVPLDRIAQSILLLRGQKVILDADLATLYGVPTKRLNEQVRRNPARFPEDFSFQLTAEEVETLRSQDATSKPTRGGRRYRPLAFTEQGVAMLSSVLNSDRAIEVNVAIMRTFVKLRELLATHQGLATKLEQHDRKLGQHDEQLRMVFEAIRQLMSPSKPADDGRRIGFHSK